MTHMSKNAIKKQQELFYKRLEKGGLHKEDRISYKLLLTIFKDLTDEHQNILPMKAPWAGVDVYDLSPTSKWHDFWRLLISANKAEKILREEGFIGCIYGMTEECPEDAPIWCTHCEKDNDKLIPI